MQRSAKIDNLRVELDCCDSEELKRGEEPAQPIIFVVQGLLQVGLSRKCGYVLMKEDDELIKSGGPRRKIIEPVGWALEGQDEWIGDVDRSYWSTMPVDVSIGFNWETEWFEGIRFTPGCSAGTRTIQKLRTYGDRWETVGDPYPGEWEDVLSMMTEGSRLDAEVLYPGDQIYLQNDDKKVVKNWTPGYFFVMPEVAASVG